MNFTPEQHAAVYTHDRNLIVTAGAGSGKTRVLVERFIALLDANPTWTLPAVVAITFTEKAAREMRDRVRAAIEGRIAQAAAEGDSAALDRWLDHQAALTSARIGTIHALCTHILRTNPAEARVDPAFEVLDETESAILIDDAVDLALAQLAAGDHPAAELLVAYGVQTVQRVLRRHAPRSEAQAVAVALDRTPGDLRAWWEQSWSDAMQEIIAAAHADADLWAAMDWIHPDDLPPGDKLSDIWRIVHAQRDALLAGDVVPFTAAVEALAGGIKVNVGAGANWGGKEGLDEAKAALKLIRAAAQTILASAPPYPCERDEQAADLLFLWRDAIQLAADIYTDLKAALDFDDLEARTHALLRDYPAVGARYADEFRHVLVDEFQDTNDAQRSIIYHLTGVQHANGRLFVVGDPKQSIYAFRGADVSVFGQVRDDLIAWGGDELPLATSFRTHDRLVSAFNDLFGHILGAENGSRYEVALGQPMTAFRPSEPDRLPHHAAPLAVIALQKPESDREFNAEELRRWEAWEIAQHIHALVQAPTLIWDRDTGGYRPMDYGDVAVLFQAMTRVPQVEEVFKAAGLPYVTVAGKGYYDRQEVWDLLNLLRALHNPADDLALAVTLRSPLFGLSDDALYALRLLRRADDHTVLPLWDALMSGDPPAFPPDDLPARAFAQAALTELRDMAGRVPIADLLTRALSLTGYPAILTGLADGARRRGNVEKLLALARDSGRISLGAFNAYARDLTTREVREGEAAVEVEGAVTLMSVHASKGLEFPVVVLADASWNRGSRGGDAFLLDAEAGPVCTLPTDDPDSDDPQPFGWEWAKTLADRRDQAERRRLLYVGATRAQEMLIVSGSLPNCRETTWLRQWLDALGITDDDLLPAPEPKRLHYPWGDCALCVPDTPPDPDILAPRPDAAASGWDAAESGETGDLPPLLAGVPVDPTAPARMLTATQIARLGRAPFYDPAQRGRAAFRHSVLFDMPEPVRPLPDRRPGSRSLRRIIGEIVHRALQAWLLPDNTALDVLVKHLRAYAWENNLTDGAQTEQAIQQALDLLRRFAASEVRQQLDNAKQIYRELPFAWNNGTRTIHGVIDVLYFDGRQWHLLDYKTAPVTGKSVYGNARRYYLQLGVYAAAVTAHTGQAPETRLYYIHSGTVIYVKKETWQSALDRFESDVRAALETQG